MKKWLPCTNCKAEPKVPNKEGWYFREDGKTVYECPCHIEWRKEGLRLAQAKRNGVEIPKDFDPNKVYATSPDLPNVRKLLRYVDRFATYNPTLLEESASVYIYSKEPIGHADLLRWMAERLSRQGWSVGVTSMRTLIEGLTPTHLFEDSDLEKVQAYHQRMVKMDFLFITEAFLPTEQNFRIPYLERFLMDRLERSHRPTIFLSNTQILSLASKMLYTPTLQEIVFREIRKSGGELVFSSGREVKLGSIFGDDE